MNHQDWTPVVWKKTKQQQEGARVITQGPIIDNKTVQINGNQYIHINKNNVETVNKRTANTSQYSHISTSAYRKLDQNDDPDEMYTAVKKVSKTLGNKLSNIRANKQLTRKQVAMAINVQEKVIQDFETGVAVFNQAILTKLNKFFGTNFKKTD